MGRKAKKDPANPTSYDERSQPDDVDLQEVLHEPCVEWPNPEAMAAALEE